MRNVMAVAKQLDGFEGMERLSAAKFAAASRS
jgi:hypothetical protein